MTKLEKMLKYVSEHNEFYKNRIKEYGIKDPLDITQWPILTRKELQENRYNMFSDGYRSKYFYQQLYRQASSGSSGTPVNVYWDYQNLYSSNLSLWRRRLKFYQVTPKDKCVMFNLHAFNSDPQNNGLHYTISPSNMLLINISLIHKNDNYREVLEVIDKFQPDWLYIQPYILNKLIMVYSSLSIRPPKSIRYIESVGEILLEELRIRAQDFFGVPIANMYGSEEMNGIAYECPFHKMHILEDNVFVECLNNGSISMYGEGESIISNVNNHAMPVIRYNQGDIIEIENETACSCGECSRTIKVVKGRKLESISVSEDIEINSFMLMEVIAEVNNQYKDMISGYTYVYHKLTDRLECFIELKNIKWLDSIKKSIIDVFFSKVNLFDYPLDVKVTQNANEFSGKHKIVKIIND